MAYIIESLRPTKVGTYKTPLRRENVCFSFPSVKTPLQCGAPGEIVMISSN